MVGVAREGYEVERVARQTRCRRPNGWVIEARQNLTILLRRSGYSFAQVAAVMNLPKPTVVRLHQHASLKVSA